VVGYGFDRDDGARIDVDGGRLGGVEVTPVAGLGRGGEFVVGVDGQTIRPLRERSVSDPSRSLVALHPSAGPAA
jgi:hypothetical protein